VKKALSADLPAVGPAAEAGVSRGRGWSLWLLVMAAFALLSAVYVVAIHFAREAQIREVPVESKGVTP
jgi:hypothetical protein